MLNVLLNPIGTFGDVNPYVGLGCELLARGHRVTVITNPYFETLVRDAGLEFVALGSVEEFQEFFRRRDIWSFGKSWKPALRWGALGTMRQAYGLIAERYEPGNTVVAAPGMGFGARVAREKLGVPLATLHLEPDKLRSLYHSPVLPPPLVLADWVPRISKRIQLWVGDTFVADPFLGPDLNAWRKELDLPPVHRIVADWWHSPQRVIGLFPSWFAPPQPDWPPQTALTEFPLWDQHGIADVPREVQSFLEAGDPPIVFTAGSANAHAHRFYAAAIESCQLSGRRAVLIAGDQRQMPFDLPDTVRCFRYVPFSYLLDRAAALVHHAGVGTCALGLAAGIPQLVMPMSFAQPDVARRLKRLGVADIIKPRAFRGPRVARVLERLLASAAVAQQCGHFQQQVRDAHPFSQTCELLEALVGHDPAVGKTE